MHDNDADSFGDEQYLLSAIDKNIVAAAKSLLWKTARSTLPNPGQLEAIARALRVFEALPAFVGGFSIEIQITSPRRMFGNHEIFHWWKIEIDDGGLSVISQGHFYRPETGGDTFTSMVWYASPGVAAEYRDYRDTIAIVDDAQPFDCEVDAIDFSQGGYSLEVIEDGECREDSEVAEDADGDDEDD